MAPSPNSEIHHRLWKPHRQVAGPPAGRREFMQFLHNHTQAPGPPPMRAPTLPLPARTSFLRSQELSPHLPSRGGDGENTDEPQQDRMVWAGRPFQKQKGVPGRAGSQTQGLCSDPTGTGGFPQGQPTRSLLAENLPPAGRAQAELVLQFSKAPVSWPQYLLQLQE